MDGHAPRPVIFDVADTRNALLRALSRDEGERLAAHLRPVELVLSDEVGRAGDLVREVIFPEAGMLSNILDSSQKVEVEVNAIGREGAWGMLWAVAETPILVRGVVQVPGWGWSLPVEALREEFARGGGLQRQALRFFDLAYAQASVCGMCNRLHTVEERLSRWLLVVREGAESDAFSLEPRLVACLLGSRVSSVPLALGVLVQAGLISSHATPSGTRIELLDVKGMEQAACECHGMLAERMRLYLGE